MVWYFYQSQNKLQKKKGKIKQKIKGKTYLAPRAKPAHPAQPAHRGRGVFCPTPRPQAARWNATELAGDTTSSPRSFQASPCLLLAPGRALEHPSSIPPLQSFLLLLPCSFPSPPENSPEHRSASAWPSTPRNPAELSSVFALLDSVDEQKKELQFGLRVTPASSDRRRPPELELIDSPPP